MSIAKDVFKHFKNVDESAKEHKIEIRKFLNDDKHTVLSINSMQGSGKTSAIIDQFANSRDAIILTQSNDKIDELVKIINNRHPELEYRAIYGLEKACSTYKSSDRIKAKVSRLRKIGILTEDIHRIICKNNECDFLTQDKAMDGRIIESVARFEAQITFGKAFHNLHFNRLILIDEADGLIVSNETKISFMPYEHELLLERNPYIPEIHRVKVPSGALDYLMDAYRGLLSNIDENQDEISKITDLIRILTQGFYSVKTGKIKEISTTVFELPPIFYFFKSVLDKQMKLVIGSATLRNHQINNESVKAYFKIAHELEFYQAGNRLKNEYENAKSLMDVKFIKAIKHYQYITNLEPEIREFEANYIPGFQIVYAMDGNLMSKRHSYSMRYFKKAFDTEDIQRKKNEWKRLRMEILMALKFYELQSRKIANKILLISFKVVTDEIDKHIKKLKKNKNFSRDPIFKKIITKPFFSNKMHGINANDEGFDLIITIGDPVDHITARLAKNLNIFKPTKRGFGIDENTDISLKNQIMRTLSSELVEAFHRGRSEIPIIAIGNFLTDEDKENQRIINEILMENGFTVKNIVNFLNRMKNNSKKEYDVFIASVFKEINFELK